MKGCADEILVSHLHSPPLGPYYGPKILWNPWVQVMGIYILSWLGSRKAPRKVEFCPQPFLEHWLGTHIKQGLSIIVTQSVMSSCSTPRPLRHIMWLATRTTRRCSVGNILRTKALHYTEQTAKLTHHLLLGSAFKTQVYRSSEMIIS